MAFRIDKLGKSSKLAQSRGAVDIPFGIVLYPFLAPRLDRWDNVQILNFSLRILDKIFNVLLDPYFVSQPFLFFQLSFGKGI